MNRFVKLGSALALLASTAACVTAPGAPGPVSLSLGSAPTPNVSPMALAMSCMKNQISTAPRALRFSVGEVKDYTGKFSNEASEGGFKITQGGSLMVISALGQLGPKIDLLERYDTRIAEQEIALSRNQLVQDQAAQGPIVRPVTAGQYFGSDYYIVGGVTEANYNISSGGAEARILGAGGGARYYAMNVAADLRLVDSRTLRVIKTVSVQKQYVGREVKADTFSFFGTTLVDFNAGMKKNEPLQLGVRATLEYGVLDLIATAFGRDMSVCQAQADYGFEHGGYVKAQTEARVAPAQSAAVTTSVAARKN